MKTEFGEESKLDAGPCSASEDHESRLQVEWEEDGGVSRGRSGPIGSGSEEQNVNTTDLGTFFAASTASLQQARASGAYATYLI